MCKKWTYRDPIFFFGMLSELYFDQLSEHAIETWMLLIISESNLRKTENWQWWQLCAFYFFFFFLFVFAFVFFFFFQQNANKENHYLQWSIEFMKMSQIFIVSAVFLRIMTSVWILATNFLTQLLCSLKLCFKVLMLERKRCW